MRRLLFLLTVFSSSFAIAEEQLAISVNIPALKVNPYHRPYVAIWLETEDRQPLDTIAVWVEQDEWLKDLRQWWRKAGRRQWQKDAKLDAVTGATRKPATYEVTWPLANLTDTVVLHIESVREEGGRSYIKQTINRNNFQPVTLPAEGELGEVTIEIIN